MAVVAASSLAVGAVRFVAFIAAVYYLVTGKGRLFAIALTIWGLTFFVHYGLGLVGVRDLTTK